MIAATRPTPALPRLLRISSSGPHSAFTLVELLVVLSIIGVLIALLFPSLRSARRSAHGVVCAANLRQIAIGWSIYALESDGAVVPGRMAKTPGTTNLHWVGNGYQFRPRWFVQMGAAAGFYAFNQPSANPADDNTKQIDNELFICPMRQEWINNRNSTYGYNHQFLGNSRFRVDPSGTSSAQNGFINFPVKIDHLSRTATTIMAADSLGTSATFPSAARRPYNVTGTGAELEQLGNHAWSLDPPRLTAEGDFCDDNYRGQARSGPDARHAGKANFLFCDTHVELLSPPEVGYAPRPDGSYALPGDEFNDQRSHNRMFSGSGRDDDPPAIAAD